MTGTWGRLLATVAVGTGVATVSWANGYKILCVKSAKATGMGEAFIVQADDPTAIAYNPAGLGQLEGEQANIHGTLCSFYTEHTSPSGERTRNEDEWQIVPSLFFTTDMGREGMSAGLGISFPNGISSEWSKNSFARYVATYSDLVVGDISPAFGMKLSDRLMLGGSISYYYSEARLESMVDSGTLSGGAPNGMDVGSRMEGDGDAWGAGVGVIYHLNRKHGIGLTYRLPYSIDYDGDLAVAGQENSISTTIDFPTVIVAGYAFRPTEKWKVEVDLDWTQWDQVDDIVINFDNGVLTDITQKQDLRNTLAYKLGTECRYSETLALRCGYIYNENATSESTWRPSLPDTDVHFLTLGCGYVKDGVAIDTALQLLYYEKRTVDNNVDFNEFASRSSVDGTYRTWAPCVSVGITYKF